MIITWYGHSCFKIQTRYQGEEVVLAIDPFSKELGLHPPQFKADIVLVTHEHSDHNNISALRGEPFLISEPGEYEIKGIEIVGISAFHDNNEGKERGEVTIFRLDIEDMALVHLADFGQSELTAEQLEELGNVDILMIPIGGTFTINGEQAVKIINQIEPKIVIPMHYKLPGLKIKLEGVDKFLESMGLKQKELREKLVIKASDLPKEETEVIVMKIG